MARRARRSLGVALALSCSVLLGCAGAEGGREVPLAGSLALDTWRLGRASGFLVYTNASESRAQQALRRVDAFVATVDRLLHGSAVAPRSPRKLFLFRDMAQFQSFGGIGSAGHAGHFDGSPFLALSLDSGLRTAVLHHEFVHVLLQDDVRGEVPGWLHEGLAEFFETAIVRHDVLTIGALPVGRGEALSGPALPLKRIVTLRKVSSEPTLDEVRRRYAESWAFVHFVLLGPSSGSPGPESLADLAQRLRRLFDLARRLREGRALDVAIEASLGERLESISEGYERHREVLARAEVQRVWHFVVPEQELRLTWAPLPESEAARVLAEYAEALSPAHPGIATLWDRALEIDPGDPVALEGRIRAAAATGDLALAHELWERLPESERRSPGAEWTAGVLDHAEYEALSAEERAANPARVEQAREHYRRALAASPDRARVLAALGNTHVLDEGSDPTPGIEALERALAIQPRAPEFRLDLATLLLREGRLAEARTQLSYVVETHPSDALVDRARDLLDRIREPN